MNSKILTIIAVFAALAIVLSISPLKFSAPYAPFLKYQVWEIAIVVALLIYGIRVGVSISFINALVLLVVYPGDLPTGPIYNLVAVLSMLFAVSLTQMVAGNRFSKDQWIILVAISTISGIIARVIVMSVVNWIVLRYPYPLGYSIPIQELPELLSIVALFNSTIVMYTIPTSYIIARAVGIGTKVKTESESFEFLEKIR